MSSHYYNHNSTMKLSNNITPAPYYYEAMGEDGPYTATNYGIEASTPEGAIYSYLYFSSRCAETAEKKVASMQLRASDDWTPVDNPNWTFVRNAYGSEAYQNNYRESEMGLMDDEEIYFKQKAGVI